MRDSVRTFHVPETAPSDGVIQNHAYQPAARKATLLSHANVNALHGELEMEHPSHCERCKQTGAFSMANPLPAIVRFQHRKPLGALR
jgi:hypothetical protein